MHKKQQQGFTHTPNCGGDTDTTFQKSPTAHLVRGFTLPELLVAMAVFVILASVVLTNFHFGSAGDDLRQSADELVANLRRIQNMAQAGELVHFDGSTKNPAVPLLTRDAVPPGGYGMDIDWTTQADGRMHYRMYGDFGGSDPCTYYTKADQTTFEYDPLCDETIEGNDVVMRPNVAISYLLPVGVPTTVGKVRVVFQAPQPIPFIDGVSGGSFLIELRSDKTGQCRLVNISPSTGFISEAIESPCKNPLPPPG